MEMGHDCNGLVFGSVFCQDLLDPLNSFLQLLMALVNDLLFNKSQEGVLLLLQSQVLVNFLVLFPSLMMVRSQMLYEPEL